MIKTNLVGFQVAITKAPSSTLNHKEDCNGYFFFFFHSDFVKHFLKYLQVYQLVYLHLLGSFHNAFKLKRLFLLKNIF